METLVAVRGYGVFAFKTRKKAIQFTKCIDGEYEWAMTVNAKKPRKKKMAKK